MRVFNDGNLNEWKSVLILALAVKTPLRLPCLAWHLIAHEEFCSVSAACLTMVVIMYRTSSVWVIAIYRVHKPRIDCTHICDTKCVNTAHF